LEKLGKVKRIMPPVEEIIERDSKYVIHGSNYGPVILVEARGALVKDANGKEYIDCIAGTAGPVLIGWGHPKVVEAIKKQAEFPHAFFGYVNLPRVELAEKLAKIAPRGLTKSWFGSGGGEAVETALKAAIKYTKKKEAISLYEGYHGMTIALSNLGQARLREGLPMVPGFRQIPSPYCYRCFYGQSYPGCDFECARALEEAVKHGSSHDVAAFVMEPIQGMGGHVYPPDKEYARIIRETCDKHGMLIIADEIQTGLGRTGKMWGSECIGLQPDIMCVGKALGGGVPISAAIFREEVAEGAFKDHQPRETWHPSTFSGNPINCAVASAVIDVILEEKVPEKAATLGSFLTGKLKELQGRHQLIGEVRGPGLFIGVEIVKDKKTRERAPEEALKAAAMCFERGVWFGLSQQPGIGNVFKIKPPVAITRDQISKAVDVIDGVLNEVEKGMGG